MYMLQISFRLLRPLDHVITVLGAADNRKLLSCAPGAVFMFVMCLNLNRIATVCYYHYYYYYYYYYHYYCY